MVELDLRDKKVLIYGTGENAEKVVSWAKANHINIVGVLDRHRMSGDFMGIPILLWEDVNTGDADVILIAARYIYIREIYERIMPYCQRRKITILGMYGQDLSAFFPARQYGDSFDGRYVNREALVHDIDNYDIVSFDVFDTVLMRQVYEPADIFDIVEKRANKCGITQLNHFKRNRREAELRSKGANIYTIYDILQEMLGLSGEEKERLLELELKAEFEFVTARKDMSDIIKDMKKRGKTVIYVSDMYLPAEIIRKLLVANDCYEGDGIFVSCDFGTGKSGSLFGYVAEKYDVKKCIHIGDNSNADIKAPRRYGIKEAGIYKASDMFNIAGLGDIVGYMDNIADRIFVGKIINNLFNSPFAFEERYGVAKVDTVEKMVDMFLVPVAVEYVKGVEECIRDNDLDGLIFVARDGYFFKKLYEELADKGLIKRMPTYYMLISRILAMRVGVETEKEIDEVFARYALYKKSDICVNVFGKDLSEKILREHKLDEVFKKLQNYRKNYKLYLKKNDIDLKKKYLLCEFDGRGSTQYFIRRLFEKELRGFYFLSVLGGENLCNPDSFQFAHSRTLGREYSPLNAHIPLLEFCFSSPERSVCGINDDLSFEYKEEARSGEEISFMQQIQDVLLKNSVEFIEKISEYNCTINKELVEVLFNKLAIVYFAGEVKHINHIVLMDDVISTGFDVNFEKV